MLKGKGDALAMVAGMFLLGVSGFFFVALIGHGRFDATTTAALSVTYLLAVVLGPGVYIAVEQETSRVISDALARGGATAVGLRRLLGIDGALTLATLLVLTALAPVLLSRVLDEQIGLILALALSVVGSAAVYFVRGLTGGRRRFRRYAMTVAIDGATRILGCAVLVLTNNVNPVAYGLALCAGPGVAALLTTRHSAPPPGGVVPAPSPVSRLARDVSWLLIASAVSMMMANLAPVVVTAMLPDAPAIAAGFAGAVVLTRVPLLFMGTVQAMLLPGMTAAAATGDRGHFRATVARGLAVIAMIGVAAVLGTWLLGRPVISLLLGADRDTTDTAALVWLTVSAALFMAVQLLQPAMVALRRHRALVFAWLAGAVAFIAAFAVPVPPIDKGVLAQIAGPLVTLIAQLAVLAAYRRPAAAPNGETETVLAAHTDTDPATDTGRGIPAFVDDHVTDAAPD